MSASLHRAFLMSGFITGGLLLAAGASVAGGEAQAPASSSGTIPVSSSSSLQPAILSYEQLYKKAQSVNIKKNGISYYSDGRIAAENDKKSGITRVYTYQDETDSYTVLTLDKKEGEYTIDQYRHGRLMARMDMQRGYITFYNADGSMWEQQIDPVTLDVYYHVYEDHMVMELGEDGIYRSVRVIDSKTTYLSMADGLHPYSTTTYAKDGDSTVATTVYEGSLKKEVVLDGRLVQSVDEAGLVTNYTYNDNKKGKLLSRTATREDGQRTVTKAQDLVTRHPRVPFQKVMNAALKSALDPAGRYTVKTGGKKGATYVFQAGVLTLLETKEGNSYYFLDGSLRSVSDSTGRTVVRMQDSLYVRL